MLSFLKKVLGLGKKISFVLFAYVIVSYLFFYFSGTHDGPKISPSKVMEENRRQMYQQFHNSKLNSSKEGRIIVFLYRTTLCSLVGEACTDNPHDADRNFNKSWFGKAVALVALPYAYPPASGAQWVYSGLENAGFLPKTYAAEGLGFSAIRPLANLWKIFRDFSYLLLVVVLLAIGFMIMFRMKINPQTIISLENSLPRIIVTMLLITFSFAIAGFLIDIMYMTILIGVSLIAKANVGDITSSQIPALQNRFIGASLKDLWPYGGNPFLIGPAMLDIFPSIIQGVFKGIVSFAVTTMFVKLLMALPGNIIKAPENIGGGISGSLLGFGGGGSINLGNLISIPGWLVEMGLFLFFYPIGASFLLSLLFVLTLFFFIFRVFFLLFGAYIKILLLIIFSPVILLIGAIPGRNMFSFWFKNLIAELLTFPLVIIILLIGNVITYMPLAEGRLFRPPFLYSLDAQALAILIGMGITLLIPNLVKAAKETIGLKGPGLGFGAGLFFGGVTGAVSTGYEQLYKYGSLRYYADKLPGAFRNILGGKGRGES